MHKREVQNVMAVLEAAVGVVCAYTSSCSHCSRSAPRHPVLPARRRPCLVLAAFTLPPLEASLLPNFSGHTNRQSPHPSLPHAPRTVLDIETAAWGIAARLSNLLSRAHAVRATHTYVNPNKPPVSTHPSSLSIQNPRKFSRVSSLKVSQHRSTSSDLSREAHATMCPGLQTLEISNFAVFSDSLNDAGAIVQHCMHCRHALAPHALCLHAGLER